MTVKIGADDYVTKPSEMAELLARVEAHLRRLPFPPHPAEGFAPLELSAREFQLLRDFIDHRGVTLTRDELLNEVWGCNSMPSTRTVDVHVAWLRQKIEPNPRHPHSSSGSRHGLQVRRVIA